MTIVFRHLYCLYFLVCFVGSLTYVSGQELRLTKRPGLKLVNAKECNANFKIPASFTRQVTDTLVDGKTVRYYYYSTPVSDRQFTVQCGVSPWLVEDKDSLNFAYDFDGKNMLNSAQDENPKTKEILVQGHPGKQYESTRSNGTVYMRVWHLIVDDMRYQIGFGGFKTKDAAETSGELGTMMREFFKSFVITNRVKPIALSYQELLPSGYLGHLVSGKYSNDAFGFELPIPDQWREVPLSQLEGLMKVAEAESGRKMRFAMPILYLLKRPIGERPFGALNIVIQKNIFRGISLRGLAENDLRNSVSDGSAVIGDNISELVIAGQPFVRFRVDKQLAANTFKQMSYATVVKGYGVFFHLQYFDDAELNELEENMNKIRFRK
jgi:hypothetical protein